MYKEHTKEKDRERTGWGLGQKEGGGSSRRSVRKPRASLETLGVGRHGASRNERGKTFHRRHLPRGRVVRARCASSEQAAQRSTAQPLQTG